MSDTDALYGSPRNFSVDPSALNDGGGDKCGLVLVAKYCD